ncbi:MAG: alpha/beta hydrolase [Pseudomonadaceae bacterium]|nr:alpha/beta hydrolase [Pseudomonadaceae bacterium]
MKSFPNELERRALSFLEGPRFAAQLPALFAASPWLATAPRGDGSPVMVLPGFGTNDLSTALLRGYLSFLGYRVSGWGLGRNLGFARVGGIEPLVDRLSTVANAARSVDKVALVGHSLGGVFARRMATHSPQLVSRVVSLGSPISGNPTQSPLWTAYRQLNPEMATPAAIARVQTMRAVPPPVPASAIFSRSDAIVHWHRAQEVDAPQSESIEVIAGHMALLLHAPTFYAVADRLAQPTDNWRSFQPPASLAGWLYPGVTTLA